MSVIQNFIQYVSNFWIKKHVLRMNQAFQIFYFVLFFTNFVFTMAVIHRHVQLFQPSIKLYLFETKTKQRVRYFKMGCNAPQNFEDYINNVPKMGVQKQFSLRLCTPVFKFLTHPLQKKWTRRYFYLVSYPLETRLKTGL